MIPTETAGIVQIFKDRGFKATPQRIAVYKYLCEHRTHPDVESVYRAVLEDNPAFSKTTVYNALQALDACGLIIPVTIDSGRIHYDADTRFHGHFRCEKCGRIYDFIPDLIGIQGLDGFTVHHKDVYFSGICSCCQ